MDALILILAGGAGRRMGGRDKGLVEIDGVAAIDRLLAALPPGRPVAISANRNLAAYGARGVRVIADRRDGYAGPLAGLEAGFAAADADLVVSLPVDADRLPTDCIERLLAALAAAPGAAVAVAHDGRRRQGLFAAWRRAAVLPVVGDCLDTGIAAVWQLQERLAVVEVEFDAASGGFGNRNHDPAAAEARRAERAERPAPAEVPRDD